MSTRLVEFAGPALTLRALVTELFFGLAASVVATELTRGPVGPGSQHAGPPAALLARELERLPVGGRVPMRLGRVTYEVPAAGADRAASVEPRSSAAAGGRVLAASLLGAGRGRCAPAGWRLRRARTSTSGARIEPSAGVMDRERRPTRAVLSTGSRRRLPHRRWSTGSSHGAFLSPGAATVWMRMRVSAGRRRGAVAAAARARGRRLG